MGKHVVDCNEKREAWSIGVLRHLILAKTNTGLHPSLASLGDGLPGSVGSQRDEVKNQASILPRT